MLYFILTNEIPSSIRKIYSISLTLGLIRFYINHSRIAELLFPVPPFKFGKISWKLLYIDSGIKSWLCISKLRFIQQEISIRHLKVDIVNWLRRVLICNKAISLRGHLLKTGCLTLLNDWLPRYKGHESDTSTMQKLSVLLHVCGCWYCIFSTESVAKNGVKRKGLHGYLVAENLIVKF